MSRREYPDPSEWLAPSPTELNLVTAWVAAWNERTGDSAVAGPDLRVRGRNPDQRYPDFIAMPITISPESAPSWPLVFMCHAKFPDGTDAATVVVRAGDETQSQHEVKFSIAAAWYDGSVIRPEHMIFTLRGREPQA